MPTLIQDSPHLYIDTGTGPPIKTTNGQNGEPDNSKAEKFNWKVHQEEIATGVKKLTIEATSNDSDTTQTFIELKTKGQTALMLPDATVASITATVPANYSLLFIGTDGKLYIRRSTTNVVAGTQS